MKSILSDANATLQNNALCLLDDYRARDGCALCARNPPTCHIRAGVLSYNRESEKHRLNLPVILPQPRPPAEYTVKCEYCGETPRPPLNLIWLQDPETTPDFCCEQWQRACEMLVKGRSLSSGGHSVKAQDYSARPRKSLLTLDSLIHAQDYSVRFQESEFSEDFSVNQPAAQTCEETYGAPVSKTLNLRLSCAPEGGGRIMYPVCTNEKRSKVEDEQVLIPLCDHKPVQFGICYHQVESGVLQRYYSDGMKFLTVFPDGSAQVFYPSGLLAVIVVATEQHGRVCIVYDDSDDPSRPIRAVFQSDGRAACYHSSGNIWLVLNRSGGQCFADAGVRVCRWSWSSQSNTPTPLRPVFLSLNKTVGVRILENKQVFVSFLAKGQQAKLCVGVCCAQCEYKPDEPATEPSALKEDLLPAVCHFHDVTQRLLKDGANVMSGSDRATICRRLKDLSIIKTSMKQ